MGKKETSTRENFYTKVLTCFKMSTSTFTFDLQSSNYDLPENLQFRGNKLFLFI